MVTATHNPANLPIQIVEIKVSHGMWKVQKFEGNEWVDAEANVICNQQADEKYPF